MRFTKILSNSVLSRITAAAIGGFLLANLMSVFLSYIVYSFSSATKVDGVNIGTLASFLLYAVCIIWVFSAKTTRQAWLGLLIPTLVSAAGIYLLMPEGLS